MILLLQIDGGTDVIAKSFEQSYLLGVVATLIALVFFLLIKDRLELKKTIEYYQTEIREKNKQITALQTTHNERLLSIQREMITAMNNQNVVIKGVEVLLQSIKQDVENIKKS